MSKADDDAEQWYAAHARRQERIRIHAKEMGYEHYTDQHGYTIIKPPKAEAPKGKEPTESPK